MYISVSWSCRLLNYSSVGLAQMIIGIRTAAVVLAIPNPVTDITNHVSKCRVSGRESIFDLRITLQPRAAPDPKRRKWAGAPQRDDGGAAHARPRSSRSPRKRAPTVVAARRVTPQIEGVPARASGAHLLCSLSSTPSLSARLRRRRAEGETAQLQRQRRGRGGNVRVLSAIWAEQPIEHLLTKRAIWASPSGAS